MTPPEMNPYATPESELVADLPPLPGSVLPNHGPVGIGGWLILPMLGVILRPIGLLRALLFTYAPMFRNGAWERLTHRASASYHPLWFPLLAFEMLYNTALLGFSLYLAFHFFRKSTKVPKLFIVLLVASPCFLAIDFALAAMIPNLAAAAKERGIMQIAQNSLGALVWIPYFLQSVRVKNTFVRE